MTKKTLNLTQDLYRYLIDKGAREPDVLAELRQETAQKSQNDFQISIEQGQLMALLAKLIQVESYLEIGVFTGYSALAVALALPDRGRVVACDIDRQWTDIAERYWQKAGVASKFSLRIAPAKKTLMTLVDTGFQSGFDMAFIDADKANIDYYYECCLQLLKPGGLLLIDNVLWGGSVVDDRQQDKDTVALRALNDKIIQDARVDMVMLPVSDGLTLAIKRDAIACHG